MFMGMWFMTCILTRDKRGLLQPRQKEGEAGMLYRRSPEPVFLYGKFR